MIDFERKELAVIEEIKEVIDHPNADRLDIVKIQEWQCVSTKGTFKAGDKCVYFTIDSILPMEVESKIFGADAKVRLKKARVRTIKLRGAISQGLAAPASDFNLDDMPLCKDVTKKLGIGKYVPTPKKDSVLYTGGKRHADHNNPNFKRMRKPVHFKKVGAFDEPVVITEKIHGTSFLASWTKRPTETLFERINARLFGEYQFCYRSMNVQLQGDDSLFGNVCRKIGLVGTVDLRGTIVQKITQSLKINDEKLVIGIQRTKMSDTLYGRMCEKYDLKNKLMFGHAISAEIYGSGIQANYSYGCKEGEQKIVAFGFRIEGKELPPMDAHSKLKHVSIPVVPVLYVGEFPDDLTPYTTGRSVLDKGTKVREGCVVNTVSGEKGWHGSALVKDINPKYLLDKDNTEFN